MISAEETLPPGTLDEPLRWVHSSDLTDPTPFLADDLVLLTTGRQFADEDQAGVDAYVGRLVLRGVTGLGFGTEVYRAGVPEELIASCAAAKMPLFEVPYDTPFIAVARAHSEAIAAQAYARRTWALDTQRALASAALRQRGRDATLTVLARRLGHWVGMFDEGSKLVHEFPAKQVPAEGLDQLAQHSAELISRGGHAAQALTINAQPFTLFTLGRSMHLRGVIAISTSSLDAEARGAVTSVIAMAGLALQQNETLARARSRLRGQVLESLLLDDPTLARRVLGSMPAAPILVAVAPPNAPAEAIATWWRARNEDGESPAFLAESADRITLCLPAADEGLLEGMAENFRIPLGVSSPSGYDTFSRAHAQAVRALEHGGDGVIRYSDTLASSILSALATDEARAIAVARLAPLQQYDYLKGAELEQSLTTWLQHDTRLEPAAAALGIHRHTMRARIAQASALLGIDLGSFPARAELWAALQAARDDH